MMSVKKDWNFDISNSYKRAQTIILIIGIVFIATGFISNDLRELFSGIYSNIFMGMTFICFLYPMLTLKNMIPQLGIKKPYLDVSNIPLSKKQLFLDEVKTKLLPMALFIIVCGLVDATLYGRTLDGSLRDGIVINLSCTLDLFLISLIIFFQFFVGIILYFVKSFKKLKVKLNILGADAGLLLVFLFLEKFFVDKGLFLLIAGGTFFILSLIAFVVCWKDFEKICN